MFIMLILNNTFLKIEFIMKSIAIIYGSSTENTKNAADKIAEHLAEYSPTIVDVYDGDEESFLSHDILILGVSTWGVKDLQDDWSDFFNRFVKLDLSGKTIALFGLGDAFIYPDSFVDAMGILYEAIVDKDCKIIGKTPNEGYQFDFSRAIVDDEFVGLPLDDDNEHDLTDERIEKWVEQLKSEF